MERVKNHSRIITLIFQKEKKEINEYINLIGI